MGALHDTVRYTSVGKLTEKHMLQVFRIEHKDTQVGPFQTNTEFTQELARRATAQSQLRAPHADGLGLGFLPYIYVFGCLDLDSLREWFLLGQTLQENRDILARLQAMGFVLSEYLVNDGDYRIGRSGLQVAFASCNCRDEGLVVFHELSTLEASTELAFC